MAAEHERSEEYTTHSAANHDHIICYRKAPIYARQTVPVINRTIDTILFLVTVVCGAVMYSVLNWLFPADQKLSTRRFF